jgi:hypothetical protein
MIRRSSGSPDGTCSSCSAAPAPERRSSTTATSGAARWWRIAAGSPRATLTYDIFIVGLAISLLLFIIAIVWF